MGVARVLAAGLGALWLGHWAGPASAHDPGISRLTLAPVGTGFATTAVLARRDLEILVPMDLDYDGQLSDQERAQALPALRALARDAVTLSNGDRPLTPRLAEAELDDSDGVYLTQYYPESPGADISVAVPLLAELGSGHRQFLEVRDRHGQVLASTLLSASHSSHRLELARPGWLQVIGECIVIGAEHIRLGLDHLLFLLTLLLPAVLVYRAPRWESVTGLRPAVIAVLKVVTAFTLAHSITLTAAAMGWLTLPARLVEATIALSVVLTALHNLRPLLGQARWLVAFGFGLVHGFGFAGQLQALALPEDTLIAGLLGFNLGVELGQLAVVALVLPPAYAWRHSTGYRRYALQGGSLAAAGVAGLWFVERASGVALLPP